jgi:hypothetical protein
MQSVNQIMMTSNDDEWVNHDHQFKVRNAADPVSGLSVQLDYFMVMRHRSEDFGEQVILIAGDDAAGD